MNMDVQVQYSLHFHFATEPTHIAHKININFCFSSIQADILIFLLNIYISHKQKQLLKSTEIPQVDKHKATANEWYYDINCKLMCFPALDLAIFSI